MSVARTIRVLQQQEFDRLLAWLDEDKDRAGVIYEKIRWRLITILAARGCRIPEEVADETIDRVARRVCDIEKSYVGDKALYFLGVMNNVHHEYLRRPAIAEPAQAIAEDPNQKEQTHVCLEKCLAQLCGKSRSLIEQYYSADKSAKIRLRQRIARDLGITAGVLRLRALRIRQKLQMCIENCLQMSGVRP